MKFAPAALIYRHFHTSGALCLRMGPWFPGAACLFGARVYDVKLKGFEAFRLDASCVQWFTILYIYTLCIYIYIYIIYIYIDMDLRSPRTTSFGLYNSRTQEPRAYCPRYSMGPKSASNVVCVLATGTWLHFFHLVPQLTSNGRITYSE